MPGFSIDRRGSWNEARRRYRASQQDLQKQLSIVVRRAAQIVEREIKTGLSRSAPGGAPLRPLALSTILMRRRQSDRPLLDTGGLLASIHTRILAGQLSAFVGVQRTRGTRNADMVRIAEIHEFGTEPYVIPVTPALRRFFIALSIKSGGQIKPLRADTDVITHPGVPARPFIRPAMAAVRPIIESQLRTAFTGGRS